MGVFNLLICMPVSLSTTPLALGVHCLSHSGLCMCTYSYLLAPTTNSTSAHGPQLHLPTYEAPSCHSCRYLNDIFTLEIREGMSLQWVCPTIEGPCPTPRESHSAIAYGSKLIIFGGMNGRRLGDCWMLDTGEQHYQHLQLQCHVMSCDVT